MATSVLIVDDHGPFRAWARVLLEQAGYAVIAEAADGAALMRLVAGALNCCCSISACRISTGWTSRGGCARSRLPRLWC